MCKPIRVSYILQMHHYAKIIQIHFFFLLIKLHSVSQKDKVKTELTFRNICNIIKSKLKHHIGISILTLPYNTLNLAQVDLLIY